MSCFCRLYDVSNKYCYIKTYINVLYKTNHFFFGGGGGDFSLVSYNTHFLLIFGLLTFSLAHPGQEYKAEGIE